MGRRRAGLVQVFLLQEELEVLKGLFLLRRQVSQMLAGIPNAVAYAARRLGLVERPCVRHSDACEVRRKLITYTRKRLKQDK